MAVAVALAWLLFSFVLAMSADDVAWIKAELQGLGDDEKAEWLCDEARRGDLNRLSGLIKAGADVNKSILTKLGRSTNEYLNET